MDTAMLIPAQFQTPFDVGDLVYVAIILLSVLGALGKKIRDKYKVPGAGGEAPKPAAAKSAPTPSAAPTARTTTVETETPRRHEPSQAEVILAEIFDIPVRTRRPGKPAPTPPAPKSASPPSQPQERRDKPGGSQPPRARPAAPLPPARSRRAPSPPPMAKRPTPPAPKPEKSPRPVQSAASTPAVASTEPPAAMRLGDLRRAIIWSEIIAPPLALRQELQRF